jgi:ankyrin repeat protein
MRRLIGVGADVNAQDAKGNSPLHLAIPPEQHNNAITLLLSNGANLNLRDEHGEIPLQVAITLNRSPGITGSLLAGGSDISNRNIDGKTALHLAVEAERADLVPLLLEYHSDIFAADNAGRIPLVIALKNNNKTLPMLITEGTVLQSDSGGNTPLHIAVQNKADPSIIGMILDKKAPVDTRNKEGNTALHLAVMINDELTGALLITRGADIFGPNASGESPLYLALNSPGSLRGWMLTQKTLTANDGLGNTALHYIAQWKMAQYVPLLVQRGSKLEAAAATGETPLFMAARANSPETIEALLKAGALIYARDSLGNTVLHCAVLWNAQNAADTLIRGGLNVNSQNLAGKSPLHDAIRLGIPLDSLLIRRGANLEIRDAQGNTPLMEAVLAGFPVMTEKLTNNGADPIARNNRGDTPLHLAVVMQRRDLVTLLLGCGVPIHARNSQGATPFNTALVTSPEMVSILLTKDRILAADDDGLSPLHIAIKQQASPVMVQIIINQGGRISTVDSEGRTPLRLALEMNAFEEAKILADAGSDVFSFAADGNTAADIALTKGSGAVKAIFSGPAINTRDSSGNTVLHYAAKNGDAALIGILLELGANKKIKNIASESPAEIAIRWDHQEAAILLDSGET